MAEQLIDSLVITEHASEHVERLMRARQDDYMSHGTVIRDSGFVLNTVLGSVAPLDFDT